MGKKKRLQYQVNMWHYRKRIMIFMGRKQIQGGTDSHGNGRGGRM